MFAYHVRLDFFFNVPGKRRTTRPWHTQWKALSHIHLISPVRLEKLLAMETSKRPSTPPIPGASQHAPKEPRLLGD